MSGTNSPNQLESQLLAVDNLDGAPDGKVTKEAITYGKDLFTAITSFVGKAKHSKIPKTFVSKWTKEIIDFLNKVSLSTVELLNLGLEVELKRIENLLTKQPPETYQPKPNESLSAISQKIWLPSGPINVTALINTNREALIKTYQTAKNTSDTPSDSDLQNYTFTSLPKLSAPAGAMIFTDTSLAAFEITEKIPTSAELLKKSSPSLGIKVNNQNIESKQGVKKLAKQKLSDLKALATKEWTEITVSDESALSELKGYELLWGKTRTFNVAKPLLKQVERLIVRKKFEETFKEKRDSLTYQKVKEFMTDNNIQLLPKTELTKLKQIKLEEQKEAFKEAAKDVVVFANQLDSGDIIDGDTVESIEDMRASFEKVLLDEDFTGIEKIWPEVQTIDERLERAENKIRWVNSIAQNLNKRQLSRIHWRDAETFYVKNNILKVDKALAMEYRSHHLFTDKKSQAQYFSDLSEGARILNANEKYIKAIVKGNTPELPATKSFASQKQNVTLVVKKADQWSEEQKKDKAIEHATKQKFEAVVDKPSELQTTVLSMADTYISGRKSALIKAQAWFESSTDFENIDELKAENFPIDCAYPDFLRIMRDDFNDADNWFNSGSRKREIAIAKKATKATHDRMHSVKEILGNFDIACEQIVDIALGTEEDPNKLENIQKYIKTGEGNLENLNYDAQGITNLQTYRAQYTKLKTAQEALDKIYREDAETFLEVSGQIGEDTYELMGIRNVDQHEVGHFRDETAVAEMVQIVLEKKSFSDGITWTQERLKLMSQADGNNSERNQMYQTASNRMQFVLAQKARSEAEKTAQAEAKKNPKDPEAYTQTHQREIAKNMVALGQTFSEYDYTDADGTWHQNNLSNGLDNSVEAMSWLEEGMGFNTIAEAYMLKEKQQKFGLRSELKTRREKLGSFGDIQTNLNRLDANGNVVELSPDEKKILNYSIEDIQATPIDKIGEYYGLIRGLEVEIQNQVIVKDLSTKYTDDPDGLAQAIKNKCVKVTPAEITSEISEKVQTFYQSASIELRDEMSHRFKRFGTTKIEDLSGIKLGKDQENAFKLWNDIGGFSGFNNYSNETNQGIIEGAKMAAMLVAGVAVGFATCGAAWYVAGAAMAASMTGLNAALYQTTFDSTSQTAMYYASDALMNGVSGGVFSRVTGVLGKQAMMRAAAGKGSYKLLGQQMIGGSLDDVGTWSMIKSAMKGPQFKALNAADEGFGLGAKMIGMGAEMGLDMVISSPLDAVTETIAKGGFGNGNYLKSLREITTDPTSVVMMGAMGLGPNLMPMLHSAGRGANNLVGRKNTPSKIYPVQAATRIYMSALRDFNVESKNFFNTEGTTELTNPNFPKPTPDQIMKYALGTPTEKIQIANNIALGDMELTTKYQVLLDEIAETPITKNLIQSAKNFTDKFKNLVDPNATAFDTPTEPKKRSYSAEDITYMKEPFGDQKIRERSQKEILGMIQNLRESDPIKRTENFKADLAAHGQDYETLKKNYEDNNAGKSFDAELQRIHEIGAAEIEAMSNLSAPEKNQRLQNIVDGKEKIYSTTTINQKTRALTELFAESDQKDGLIRLTLQNGHAGGGIIDGIWDALRKKFTEAISTEKHILAKAKESAKKAATAAPEKLKSTKEKFVKGFKDNIDWLHATINLEHFQQKRLNIILEKNAEAAANFELDPVAQFGSLGKGAIIQKKSASGATLYYQVLTVDHITGKITLDPVSKAKDGSNTFESNKKAAITRDRNTINNDAFSFVRREDGAFVPENQKALKAQFDNLISQFTGLKRALENKNWAAMNENEAAKYFKEFQQVQNSLEEFDMSMGISHSESTATPDFVYKIETMRQMLLNFENSFGTVQNKQEAVYRQVRLLDYQAQETLHRGKKIFTQKNEIRKKIDLSTEDIVGHYIELKDIEAEINKFLTDDTLHIELDKDGKDAVVATKKHLQQTQQKLRARIKALEAHATEINDDGKHRIPGFDKLTSRLHAEYKATMAERRRLENKIGGLLSEHNRVCASIGLAPDWQKTYPWENMVEAKTRSHEAVKSIDVSKLEQSTLMHLLQQFGKTAENVRTRSMIELTTMWKDGLAADGFITEKINQFTTPIEALQTEVMSRAIGRPDKLSKAEIEVIYNDYGAVYTQIKNELLTEARGNTPNHLNNESIARIVPLVGNIGDVNSPNPSIGIGRGLRDAVHALNATIPISPTARASRTTRSRVTNVLGAPFRAVRNRWRGRNGGRGGDGPDAPDGAAENNNANSRYPKGLNWFLHRLGLNDNPYRRYNSKQFKESILHTEPWTPGWGSRILSLPKKNFIRYYRRTGRFNRMMGDVFRAAHNEQMGEGILRNTVGNMDDFKEALQGIPTNLTFSGTEYFTSVTENSFNSVFREKASLTILEKKLKKELEDIEKMLKKRKSVKNNKDSEKKHLKGLKKKIKESYDAVKQEIDTREELDFLDGSDIEEMRKEIFNQVIKFEKDGGVTPTVDGIPIPSISIKKLEDFFDQFVTSGTSNTEAQLRALNVLIKGGDAEKVIDGIDDLKPEAIAAKRKTAAKMIIEILDEALKESKIDQIFQLKGSDGKVTFESKLGGTMFGNAEIEKINEMYELANGILGKTEYTKFYPAATSENFSQGSHEIDFYPYGIQPDDGERIIKRWGSDKASIDKSKVNPDVPGSKKKKGIERKSWMSEADFRKYQKLNKIAEKSNGLIKFEIPDEIPEYISDDALLDKFLKNFATILNPGKEITDPDILKMIEDMAKHKGITLLGQPGVGKDFLVNALSYMSETPQFNIERIGNQYVNSDTIDLQKIRKLSLEAAELSPSGKIIWNMSEMERIIGSKGHDQKVAAAKLLQAWTEGDDEFKKKIVLVGSTNFIQDILPAFNRRMPYVVGPRPPIKIKTKTKILEMNMKGINKKIEKHSAVLGDKKITMNKKIISFLKTMDPLTTQAEYAETMGRFSNHLISLAKDPANKGKINVQTEFENFITNSSKWATEKKSLAHKQMLKAAIIYDNVTGYTEAEKLAQMKYFGIEDVELPVEPSEGSSNKRKKKTTVTPKPTDPEVPPVIGSPEGTPPPITTPPNATPRRSSDYLYEPGSLEYSENAARYDVALAIPDKFEILISRNPEVAIPVIVDGDSMKIGNKSHNKDYVSSKFLIRPKNPASSQDSKTTQPKKPDGGDDGNNPNIPPKKRTDGQKDGNLFDEINANDGLPNPIKNAFPKLTKTQDNDIYNDAHETTDFIDLNKNYIVVYQQVDGSEKTITFENFQADLPKIFGNDINIDEVIPLLLKSGRVRIDRIPKKNKQTSKVETEIFYKGTEHEKTNSTRVFNNIKIGDNILELNQIIYKLEPNGEIEERKIIKIKNKDITSASPNMIEILINKGAKPSNIPSKIIDQKFNNKEYFLTEESAKSHYEKKKNETFTKKKSEIKNDPSMRLMEKIEAKNSSKFLTQEYKTVNEILGINTSMKINGTSSKKIKDNYVENLFSRKDLVSFVLNDGDKSYRGKRNKNSWEITQNNSITTLKTTTNIINFFKNHQDGELSLQWEKNDNRTNQMKKRHKVQKKDLCSVYGTWNGLIHSRIIGNKLASVEEISAYAQNNINDYGKHPEVFLHYTTIHSAQIQSHIPEIKYGNKSFESNGFLSIGKPQGRFIGTFETRFDNEFSQTRSSNFSDKENFVKFIDEIEKRGKENQHEAVFLVQKGNHYTSIIFDGENYYQTDSLVEDGVKKLTNEQAKELLIESAKNGKTSVCYVELTPNKKQVKELTKEESGMVDLIFNQNNKNIQIISPTGQETWNIKELRNDGTVHLEYKIQDTSFSKTSNKYLSRVQLEQLIKQENWSIIDNKPKNSAPAQPNVEFETNLEKAKTNPQNYQLETKDGTKYDIVSIDGDEIKYKKNNEIFAKKKSEIKKDPNMKLVEKVEAKNIRHEVEIKRKEIKNKIEKAFVAVEASEKFKSLDTNLKEIVIGETIQHISIFGHDAYLQDYLSNLHNFFEKAKEPNRIDKFKKTKEQFILNCILKELQLTDIESAENRKKIGEWLLNPKQQFVFHGFNGSFSEKIKQEGLSTDNRTYDVKKVNDMYNFLEDKIRKNHSVFGWYKINSEKKIFSGNNAENIYQYSINSPEWFSQFVAEGFHIDSSQNKNAFKERNYKDAKANVVNFCDKNIRNEKFNEDDKNKILDFFEFFWPIFTKKNSKPMVAIMSIHDFLGIEIKDNSNINKDISKQSIMGLISSMDGDKDLSSKKSVPPKNITFVELPHI